MTAGPADNTIAIGKGVGDDNRLVNNIANSLMVGFGSPTPILFVSGSSVGIRTASPNGTLDVNGPIYQRGGVLHADYVFEPGYELESIDEHSEFMWKNKHLAAIPKAKVDEAGMEIVEVGAHRKGIVEELEKAHIYIQQLHKHTKELDSRNQKLREQNQQIEKRLESIERKMEQLLMAN